MDRRFAFPVLSILLLGAPSAATAQPLDVRIDIPSRTITDTDFLRGNASAGTPVTLSGRLIVPRDTGRQPVVILLHGSDGPRSASAGGWQDHLNGKGIATLRLDSFTGRGLKDISGEQNSFGQFVQLYDAYRAADALAEHPRVDGSRIVLMGFSRGGNAALYSAMRRFQTAFGPAKARLIAHLPFYAACNFELVGELDVTAAPIRLFHGALDDWTPIAPCRAYVDRLAAAGRDATITEYAGARHAFDSVLNPAYVEHPDAQTSRNCVRREVDGQLINPDTGRAFDYSDACVERGTSVQYNANATNAARAAIIELLGKIFAAN